MKKIVFDIRTTHKSGIFRYGTTILERLIQHNDLSDFQLFIIHNKKKNIIENISNKKSSNIEFVEIDDDFLFIKESESLREFLLKENIDLYYSINYIVDYNLPVDFIYTIHDLIRIRYPESTSYTDSDFRKKFGDDEFKRMEEQLNDLITFLPKNAIIPEEKKVFLSYFWSANRVLGEKSKKIVTVSQTVKNDISKILSVPNAKIHVVPNAADKEIFHPNNENNLLNTNIKEINSECFTLFVGLPHERKRIPWLLNIFSEVQSKLPGNAKLIMVGKYLLHNNELRRMIKNLSLENFVLFTGGISDNELAYLYSKAKALIISSIDEGFCLPALETLCCGTEVIVPNIHIMQEVVGNHGHYYEVSDSFQLSNLIIKAYHNALPIRSKSYKNKFDWDKSALKLKEIFL